MVQARTIIGGEDHKPSRFGHTSQLLHSWLALPNPWDDADGQHQIQGFILESPGIDIPYSNIQPLCDASLHRVLACQLYHRLHRIDGLNAKSTLGEVNS